MKRDFGALLLGTVLLAVSLPAWAHHSGAAEFDSTKKIEISGVVTRLEWTNPHAHFYMDVTDGDGNVAHWNLELASPNVLIRNGWTRHSLKPGDHVTVTGVRAKDNPFVGSAGVIKFPDGHELHFLAADDQK